MRNRNIFNSKLIKLSRLSQMEESSPPPSLQSEDSADTSLSSSEEAKRFLQSVCRAYYPKFTSAIEDTYFSYQVKMVKFTAKIKTVDPE